MSTIVPANCRYTGCPMKHDSWRIVLNVFFHLLNCIAVYFFKKSFTKIYFTKVWLPYSIFLLFSLNYGFPNKFSLNEIRSVSFKIFANFDVHSTKFPTSLFAKFSYNFRWTQIEIFPFRIKKIVRFRPRNCRNLT